MKKNKFITLSTLLSLVMFLAQISSASAQFPVVDAGAIVQSVKGNAQYLQQYEQITSSTKSSEGMLGALGDNANTFAEYAEQAEERKAELEERKAQYNEKKEKYEKRKKQLKAAKEKVEKTVDTVKDAKEKYDGYKEQYDSYKETVDNAVDTVQKAGTAAQAVKSGDFKGAAKIAKETAKDAKNTSKDIKNQSQNMQDTSQNLKTDVKTIFKKSESENEVTSETVKEDENKSKKEGFRKRPKINADAGIVSLAHSAGSQTMVFAKQSGGYYSGHTENMVFVLPDALAEYCEINAEDAATDGVIEECLQKLMEERASKNNSRKTAAANLCQLAVQQYFIANIAEAAKIKVKVSDFEEKTLPKMEKKARKANDVNKNLNVLSLNDTESVKLLSTMMSSYASRVGQDALITFCNTEVTNTRLNDVGEE